MKHHMIVSLFAASLLAGCSKYGATVHGNVRLDGQNLPRGKVVFSPVEKGPPATGKINADGSYALKVGTENSLPAGVYTATVVAHEQADLSKRKDGAPPPIPKRLTPVKYQKVNTSGLSYTVEKGDNQIDIDLTTK